MNNFRVSVITPELVTFTTNLRKLRGFNLSENLDFYKKSKDRGKFHYTLIMSSNLKIPKSYEFRNGYYFKYGGCWYYERKIIPGLSLKFKYDPKNKVFYFNRLYSLIPFEIGGILPLGKHVSDFINLDLFLNDFVIFRGCSYRNNSKIICAIAPSCNGKTTLIKSVLQKGGGYIAEDILIINFNENKVYPSSPHFWNYFRTTNKELSTLKTTQIVDSPRGIDNLYLFQNSLGLKYKYTKKKNLFEYLIADSLFFLNNLMLRSFIVEEGLSESLMKKIEDIKKIKGYNFINIKDFKYKK